MMSRRGKTSRRSSTLLAAVGAMLLLGAMAAWACTNLATLNLEKASGTAGESIGVTGSSFSTSEQAGPVELHWDGAEGPVLASAEVDPAGNIVADVTVPSDAQPGSHVVIATQTMTRDNGDVSNAFGTPARAVFTIGETVAPEAPVAATGDAPAATGAETSTGMVALIALLAIAGLGLFGAGIGLFVRELRPREAPARAKSE